MFTRILSNLSLKNKTYGSEVRYHASPSNDGVEVYFMASPIELWIHIIGEPVYSKSSLAMPPLIHARS